MVEESATETVVELSPKEQQASEMGWQNKDAWVESGKDPDLWKPASAYIEHGELMARIEKQGKVIDSYKRKQDSTDDTLKRMAQHQAKLIKQEQDRILKQLKKDKARALTSENPGAVVEIDDQIKEVEKMIDGVEDLEGATKQAAPTDERAHEQQVTKEWINSPGNEWYTENFMLHREADQYYDFCRFTRNLSPEEAVAATDKHIKKSFPQEFGGKETSNSRKVLDSGSNDGGTRSTSGKKHKVSDLTADERIISREMVEMGAFKTEQDYVDRLASSGYFVKK